VEDNPDHVLLAQKALRERGHSASAVFAGREACGAIAAGGHDVAALDYQLPDATGLEVLEAIRGEHPSFPVVMVTAAGSEEVAVAALKSGASDYVVKTPGYERVLARALELAVEKARAEEAQARLQAELERRASTDPLTGLLNRGEMEQVLRDEMERAQRYRRELSLGIMDIDGFKGINDRFGHPAGDAVLCQLARLLREEVRCSDSVARWGGDEFVVLLPEAGLVAARGFARRLHQHLGEQPPLAFGSKKLPAITVSLGFVSVAPGGAEFRDLPKWADRALYAAKRAGPGKSKYFGLSGQEAAQEEGSSRAVPGEGRRQDGEA
jgi:diguanylate cyclase (GGDEF)-like protein